MYIALQGSECIVERVSLFLSFGAVNFELFDISQESARSIQFQSQWIDIWSYILFLCPKTPQWVNTCMLSKKHGTFKIISTCIWGRGWGSYGPKRILVCLSLRTRTRISMYLMNFQTHRIPHIGRQDSRVGCWRGDANIWFCKILRKWHFRGHLEKCEEQCIFKC